MLNRFVYISDEPPIDSVSGTKRLTSFPKYTGLLLHGTHPNSWYGNGCQGIQERKQKKGLAEG